MEEVPIQNEQTKEEELAKNNLISLTVADEDLFRINRLHTKCSEVQEKIEKASKKWQFRPMKDKAYFIARDVEDKPTVILTADWYLIGEFRIFNLENSDVKSQPYFEFCWSWALWESDSKTKDVIQVSESLPESLHKIKDAMFRSPDFRVLRVISAYAFDILELEYMYSSFNPELNSRGMFGFKNLEWNPKITFEDIERQIELNRLESENKKIDNIQAKSSESNNPNIQTNETSAETNKNASDREGGSSDSAPTGFENRTIDEEKLKNFSHFRMGGVSAAGTNEEISEGTDGRVRITKSTGNFEEENYFLEIDIKGGTIKINTKEFPEDTIEVHIEEAENSVRIELTQSNGNIEYRYYSVSSEKDRNDQNSN